MEKIPTAEEVIAKIVKFESTTDTIECTVYSLSQLMIEFSKLHVEAALEAAANEYYPKDKENFELVAERFINAYPLENIK
jgi:hypothetical protein